MYKQILLNDKTVELSYPANMITSFYMDGALYPYYTIIAVVSIGNKMYAMLENNEVGEDDCPVVYLGKGQCTNCLVMERYNREEIDVNLSNKAERVIFIPTKNIIIEQAYDNLYNILCEEGYIKDNNQLDESNKVYCWNEEDINKESFIEGGLIK